MLGTECRVAEAPLVPLAMVPPDRDLILAFAWISDNSGRGPYIVSTLAAAIALYCCSCLSNIHAQSYRSLNVSSVLGAPCFRCHFVWMAWKKKNDLAVNRQTHDPWLVGKPSLLDSAR